MERPNKYPEVDLPKLRHPDGRKEILDPTPMQPPLGYNKTPSLALMIRDQVRRTAIEMRDFDPETIEEADDFEIPDEPTDPHTRWENDFEPSISEVKKRYQERMAEAAKEREIQRSNDRPPVDEQNGNPRGQAERP